MAEDSKTRKYHVKGRYKKKSDYLKSQRMKQLNLKKRENDENSMNDHGYSRNESLNDIFAENNTVDISVAEIEIKTLTDSDKDFPWHEGRRVVELKVLANQLECEKCGSWLRLADIVSERRYGLGSLLDITCQGCGYLNLVSTGKKNEKGAFDINSKAALGMLNAGLGAADLNTFLTACNIPPINPNTIRKREKELSNLVIETANESCSKAREEEKKNDNSVACRFDGGWQKRGSGFQYNSTTGHASLIGHKTGKVLDFDIRSKVCSICQYYNGRNETLPQHDCNCNWTGSSKAMEPDMACSMLKHLRQEGIEVAVLHADNDTTTSSRIKKDFGTVKKRDDKNHVKKNLSKQLYALSKTHQQLRAKGVNPYIVRCFMYTCHNK